MQIPISDSRGDLAARAFYVGESAGTLVSSISLPDDATLLFAGSQAAPRWLSYDLNYHLLSLIANDPAPLPGETNLALWSLIGAYVGLETQNSYFEAPELGNITATLQVSNLSITTDRNTYYTGHTQNPSVQSQINRLIYYSDATSGFGGMIEAEDASPGVVYLELQYIYFGSHNLALAAASDNLFIHTDVGNDAVALRAGQNVVDAGSGSNFLVSGTGTDTFFLDLRTDQVVWNTIVNFHAADAVTLWGFDPGLSRIWWDGISGASNAPGATLRIDRAGGFNPSASITFAGLSELQGSQLQIVSGNVSQTNYLFIYNPGV